ncbi:MAG: hypothetical protein K0S80_1717 [Neobacillus sp.]|nr:hypothetical protein [Neobacillus sp.]
MEYAITRLEELLDYVHFVKNAKGDYLLGGSTIMLSTTISIGAFLLNLCRKRCSDLQYFRKEKIERFREKAKS